MIGSRSSKLAAQLGMAALPDLASRIASNATDQTNP
jgi:hypothetical protein